jgi:hypothetical protein
MTIQSDWHSIETELERSPRILADLRPPITSAELTRWADNVGDLPRSLQDLYGVHAGTATLGAGGFAFIGQWYPLAVDEALIRYERCLRLAQIWEHPPLIPFAIEPTGCHLAVRPGSVDELHIIFDDAPEGPYSEYSDIETLVTATVEGLRGASPDYRAELTEQYLSWINLEEEADDLGY